MSKTIELREQRAGLIHQARELVERAEKESREFEATEEDQYEKLLAEAGKLKDRYEREEALEGVEASLNESISTPLEAAADGEVREGGPRGTKEYGERFRRYLTGGVSSLSGDEYRALQADDDEAGGFTVASEHFVARLIKAVDDLVHIRRLATVIPVRNANSLGIPSLDADPADADWTSEIATGNEDSTMDFGKRVLQPHPLAKRIKISRKLLSSSAIPIESLVRDRLAYKFGVTQEKGFLTGTGANEPLGIFTASGDGISTGRDVSTGNTSTAIKADGLKECKYSLKPQYRNGGKTRWLFHRDAVKMIAKLKDGQGNYLWAESVRVGEPDRLLNIPVLESEFAPSTFTAALYVGMLADFSHYWIADALSMAVQRLDELYAAANQVGFIGRLETDGLPVLEEAFARVTLAA